jgi:hypothetical protein
MSNRPSNIVQIRRRKKQEATAKLTLADVIYSHGEDPMTPTTR